MNQISLSNQLRAKLFTDGGARGNPGPAAIGGVLTIGNKNFDFFQYIGSTTNNQAEYQALVKGLEFAQKHHVEELDCFLDSELVVRQINRQYKVKDAELAKQFVKVWNIARLFKKITFTHVPRELNKRADELVNQALDQQQS